MSNDAKELKRITPFTVRVLVRFVPDAHLRGYRLHASGEARIGDKRISINATPQLDYASAQMLCILKFDISVNANSIVPELDNANTKETP